MKKQINREDDLTTPAEIIKTPEGISVKEAGRRGGIMTRARHGREFYQKIGATGGKRTAELYADLLVEFGRRGGRPRRLSLAEQPGEEHSEKEGDSGRSLSSSSPG